MNNTIDKYVGCLIGGAAGDALGGVIEFMSADEIFSAYGEKGITEYDKRYGAGLITDDTQMTLFTANALIVAVSDQMLGREFKGYREYLIKSYEDWLETQSYEKIDPGQISWLNNVREMNVRRAPGNTCCNAIKNGADGKILEPINNSKGCGGVMRVAPIGLMFKGRGEEAKGIAWLAAEAAALTHGHDLGFIPAAAFAHIINAVSHYPEITLEQAVEESVSVCKTLFGNFPSISIFTDIMEKAVFLSKTSKNDLEAIRSLGEGWVAEEALAISVYCALKYQKDFEKAITAAVNHDGDSDSTGAIAGNILGAYLGLKAIPRKYTANLELTDVITEIAEDIFKVSDVGGKPSFDNWNEKYVYHTYRGKDVGK